MVKHELKTWPAMFEAVWRGDKTFEVRLDDRGYQRGDHVVLREWDRNMLCECASGDHATNCPKYSGRRIEARVGHVLASTAPRGSQRGFNGNGYVVFSLCEPIKVDGRVSAATATAAARVAGAPR